ncbi:MAG: alpha/beta hydrolase [Candidatus Aenigmarchaeota archaeon]|nr:alpha/beta hydrolase [Candidatus Aenigmarchaeota archaeon]
MEEKIWFKSDSLILYGVLSSSEKKSKKCVLLCHGITVSKDISQFKELSEVLLQENYDSLRFDIRSHGESEGDSLDLTVKGWKTDIKNSIKFLKERGYEEFIILANSFSGGPALMFSEEEPNIKSVILVAALVDYSSILDPKTKWASYIIKSKINEMKKKGYIKIFGGYKVGKALYEDMQQFNPWKALEKLDIPVLFIHGDKDLLVPCEDSIKYSKICHKGKLIIIKGAGHDFDKRKQLEEVGKEIISFLKNNF